MGGSALETKLPTDTELVITKKVRKEAGGGKRQDPR